MLDRVQVHLESFHLCIGKP